MEIYKVRGKKGESWGIDFYDNGKRIKKIVSSKKEAMDIQRLVNNKKQSKKRALINRAVGRIEKNIDPVCYEEEMLRRKLSNPSTLKNIISGKWIIISPSDLKFMKFPGVYIIFTSKKKCLYVGTGKTLKRRIANKDHVSQIKEKAHKLGVQKSELKKLIFQIRVDKKDLERLSLEQRIIKFLKPICNESRQGA